jgi:hypothetical protein
MHLFIELTKLVHQGPTLLSMDKIIDILPFQTLTSLWTSRLGLMLSPSSSLLRVIHYTWHGPLVGMPPIVCFRHRQSYFSWEMNQHPCPAHSSVVALQRAVLCMGRWSHTLGGLNSTFYHPITAQSALSQWRHHGHARYQTPEWTHWWSQQWTHKLVEGQGQLYHGLLMARRVSAGCMTRTAVSGNPSVRSDLAIVMDGLYGSSLPIQRAQYEGVRFMTPAPTSHHLLFLGPWLTSFQVVLLRIFWWTAWLIAPHCHQL